MHSGPNIKRDGLVLALDGASRRSTLKKTQVNNILPDPGNWTVGTGGQTGYSPNGSSSEQNRVFVSDDPWGRSSVTWRTTPDATSGADGGWDSSYYAIDPNYTYRYSMWVRRYTTGTGGTFYMGMNPNPIRNDNNASQGNPYFTYPSIASLTYNQWYLVVAHVFHEGYTGGRHPESGWYENGVKISDKSFGNVGSSDVRWASGTTSARHRAYHYYTTNTASGIEFAYPRIDKIDGKEPKLRNLISRGESGFTNLANKNNITSIRNGTQYALKGPKSSFVFDGTDDDMTVGQGTSTSLQRTVEMVFKTDTHNAYYMPIAVYTRGANQTAVTGKRMWLGIQNNKFQMHGWGTNDPASSTTISTGKYYHAVYAYNQSIKRHYVWINGVLENDATNGEAGFTGWNSSSDHSWFVGGDPDHARWTVSAGRSMDGEVPLFRVYDKILSTQEVQQNYRAYKNRFDL
jgi:hypothetical protein